MGKARYWIMILFMLVVLVLIVLNLVGKDKIVQQETINTNAPTYKSDYSDTVVYRSDGVLNYRFIAQHIEYFSDDGISCLTHPVITTFDTNKVPTWSIRSDRAKLTNDYMLYLYGHVEVNALTSDAELRKITTNHAQINLITQDMMSQDLITLYGATFNSSGLRMYGNLRSKNTELAEKVRASYEIQNKQI